MFCNYTTKSLLQVCSCNMRSLYHEWLFYNRWILFSFYSLYVIHFYREAIILHLICGCPKLFHLDISHLWLVKYFLFIFYFETHVWYWMTIGHFIEWK
jgi:hypothetical protein